MEWMVLMNENKSDCRRSVVQSTEESKVSETGGEFSPYAGHAIGGESRLPPRHIIGPSWVSHFPVRHSCIGQGPSQTFMHLTGFYNKIS